MKHTLALLTALLLAPLAALHAADTAVTMESAPAFSEPKEIAVVAGGRTMTQTVCRVAEFRGLKIRLLSGESRVLGADKTDNAFLRANERGALEFLNRPTLLGVQSADKDRLALPVIEPLAGYPGIVTANDLYAESTVRFELSKPARVYAYLDWRNAPRAGDDKPAWRRFRAEPWARHSAFYRDFPAGTNEFKVAAGFFCGIGVCPLDRLGAHEKIVAVAETGGGEPALRIRSEHGSPQELTLVYAWRDPAVKTPVCSRETKVTINPGANSVPTPAEGIREGVVYWLDATLKGAGSEWKLTAPFGHLPVPPGDASVLAPIIPYGAYIKIESSDDPEVYDRLLAATFHHLRKLKMNAAVLATPEAPPAHLDLAQRYGIRAVVRLHRVGGAAQEAMMRHPAVLTYMIGDEPKIGPKLDAHVAQFEALTKKYPQFKPVTCTIFDDWGTGSDADPDRIYNDHLRQFDLIRLGRLYSFQKLDYGVGKPIAYKPRLDATSIMLGIEADAKRDWWLVPPFFGQPVGAPAAAQYWRTPTGREMANFMHLALAHRCAGILGWGTHSHQQVVQGLLFDGRTMQIADADTYAAMAAFGGQFTRIKPVLRAFTPSLIPVHRSRPFALDVQSRWLKTGQMAIYAVNRDLENEAAADLLVLIADRLVAKYKKEDIQPEAFVAEIAGVKDVLTGKPADWKHETQHNRFDYLRITDKLAPGDARLYLVSGKHNGTFSEKALPPGTRENVFDKAYAPID